MSSRTRGARVGIFAPKPCTCFGEKIPTLPSAVRDDRSGEQKPELLRTNLRQNPLILAEDRVGQLTLGLLQLDDPLLDRVVRDETRGDHATRLPDAVRTIDRLRFHGRVPPRIE